MMSNPSIERILVPHDFSETAEYALRYALLLAEKFGARIIVLHTYEIPSYSYPEAFVTSVESTVHIEEAARKALEAVVARAQRPDLQIDMMLRRGTAWTEIGSAAQETKADLIAMGTHGRRGVARALLGSVAEKVVRTAPCPVLTVHPSDAERQAD
ncbi:MAG: universal stress protein [Myxococcota bacterium]|nr:universal stress protein [Myxococcota bacterium]